MQKRVRTVAHGDFRARVCGFTLIELMIVVAVIAILAAVAVPAYFDSIRKSRRADAIATLSRVQQAQERWRANCPCYAGSLTAANTGCPATDCATTSGLALVLGTSQYSFAMPVAPAIATPNTYTIAATGLGGQASDRATGVSCTTLSITVTNGIPVNAPAACWNK